MRSGFLGAACFVLVFAGGCGSITRRVEPSIRDSCVESQQFGAVRLDFPVDSGKGFVILPATERTDGSRPWVWIAPTVVIKDDRQEEHVVAFEVKNGIVQRYWKEGE